MSAFGRGKRRGLLLAPSLGARRGRARRKPRLGRARRAASSPIAARGIRLLSPEAPPSFGEVGDVEPLVAAFNAARAPQDGAPEPHPVRRTRSSTSQPLVTIAPVDAAALPEASPAAPDERLCRRDWRPLAPAPVIALRRASAQDNPPPGFPAATRRSLMSPMQSALEAATERLVAEADQPNPLGAGDWRAARAAIAFFYAARDYQPVWVGDDGLTEAGRAALSQLERARDDGLDLPAMALPREHRPGLGPDALAEAETTIASAVVIYAEQATGSRVAAIARFAARLRAAPSVAEPGAALAETAAAADPARRLADFNPPQKGYRELREEWKRLTETAPSASRSAEDSAPIRRPAHAGRRRAKRTGRRAHP